MNILTYMRVINNQTNRQAAEQLNLNYARYNSLTSETVNPFDRLYYKEVIQLCKVYHIPTTGVFNELEFTQKLFKEIQHNKLANVADILDTVSKYNLNKMFIEGVSPKDALKLSDIEELCMLLDLEYAKPKLHQSILETGQIILNNAEILGVELNA